MSAPAPLDSLRSAESRVFAFGASAVELYRLGSWSLLPSASKTKGPGVKTRLNLLRGDTVVESDPERGARLASTDPQLRHGITR
jgi:hypothetical protein